MSRIEDVLYADYITQNPTQAPSKKNAARETPSVSPGEEAQNAAETPTSMTLLDFMNWGPDLADNEAKKDSPTGNSETLPSTEGEVKHVHKLQNIVTNNKLVSYLENIGGLKSPTARHWLKFIPEGTWEEITSKEQVWDFSEREREHNRSTQLIKSSTSFSLSFSLEL